MKGKVLLFSLILFSLLLPLGAVSSISPKATFEFGTGLRTYFDSGYAPEGACGGDFRFFYSPYDYVYFGGGLSVLSVLGSGNIELDYYGSFRYLLPMEDKSVRASFDLFCGAFSYTKEKTDGKGKTSLSFDNTKLILGFRPGIYIEFKDKEDSQVYPVLNAGVEFSVTGTSLSGGAFASVGFGIF